MASSILSDWDPDVRPHACEGETLLLYYDDYHTPFGELVSRLPGLRAVDIVLAPCTDDAPDGVERIDRIGAFADEMLSRAIKANARYQHGYNLSAALARPALARGLAAVVADRGVRTIVHGFAGNDQLRIEAAIRILCPNVAIRSAVDLIGSRTRANAGGFTRSANLWGATLEAGSLGEPGFASGDLVFGTRATPGRIEVEIAFEAGLPVSIGGTEMALVDLIVTLGAIGTEAGIGWHDMIEDGHVGLKTRALYHSPAADILLAAHRDLQHFTASRRENAFAAMVEAQWATLVYEGGWFDPFRVTLDAYVDAANRHATGTVRVGLSGGQVRVLGRQSPHALYDEAAAVYRVGQDFGGDLVTGLSDQATTLGRLDALRKGGDRCAA